jgi:transcriptional regulator with XRE-family HTH domain
MLALEGMMNAHRNRGMYLRVGERLAEIRKSRKISQAKLAKLLSTPAQSALLDLQLTEADRRPFKLPLQLGELPIEPAEERLSSLRVALRRRRCHTNLAESRKCGLSQRRWS